MIPGGLLSAFPHRQFHTLPGLLDSWAALPNSYPNALRATQGGSLYHFYDGLWYDPHSLALPFLAHSGVWLWLVGVSGGGSLSEMALSGASVLASTCFKLFYGGVHVLYTGIGSADDVHFLQWQVYRISYFIMGSIQCPQAAIYSCDLVYYVMAVGFYSLRHLTSAC